MTEVTVRKPDDLDRLDMLDAVLDAESYERLRESRPEVLEVITVLVRDGITPDKIRERIAKRGPWAENLADWCQAAARHLERGERNE